ncbi:MAG: NFACT RNA binding domain-containing protein [bacterium]|nr:NFACT RNA binding domain-containing protein [bacterium]
MRKIDFSSLNIKKLLKDEVLNLLPSKIEKVYFKNFLDDRFLTFETENFSLTFLCNKNFSFMFKDIIDGEKLKINFSEPLKNFCKGVRIKDIVQFGFERILKFELSNAKNIFFILIPLKFNIIVTDENLQILNLYSFPKDRNGKLIYRIGEKIDVQFEEDYSKYIDKRTKKFMSEKNLDLKSVLDLDNYLLESKGKFFISPFVDETSVVIKKDPLITNLVKEYLSFEEESLKNKRKLLILKQIEKEMENIKETIENDEGKIFDQKIKDINEKIETLKENSMKIEEPGIYKLKSVFDENKIVEIFVEKNPFYTLDKLYKSLKELKEDFKKFNLKREKLLKRLSELEKKKANINKIPIELKKEKEEKKFGKIFYSPNGFTVLCGRNSEENDLLTLKIASKDDLFFHAREAKGAHVILKKGGRIPKKEDIYYAAAIAAYNSKGKHSKLVPVSYTERRYVTKRKGSSSGEVILLREEVIFVEPKEK